MARTCTVHDASVDCDSYIDFVLEEGQSGKWRAMTYGKFHPVTR